MEIGGEGRGREKGNVGGKGQGVLGRGMRARMGATDRSL
jgi:hypothetical protein